MKSKLQDKLHWLSTNFQGQLVALVWVALIFIWFNVERAIYILKAPWGPALLLFSVVVALAIALWSLTWVWRGLTGEVKWWVREISSLQLTVMHSIRKTDSTTKPDKASK